MQGNALKSSHSWRARGFHRDEIVGDGSSGIMYHYIVRIEVYWVWRYKVRGVCVCVLWEVRSTNANTTA
jgi:hypothetical protein